MCFSMGKLVGIENQFAAILGGKIREYMDRETMVRVTENWPDVLYAGKLVGPNIPEGWAGEFRTPAGFSINESWDDYLEMAKWIMENISRPKQNAYWTWRGHFVVYIRKPQDLTAFLLRWS